MSEPLFMSQEHVDIMNALLDGAPTVEEACRTLPQATTMAYVLADGPDGETVHWTVRFGQTVQFALEPTAAADLVFTGDWRRMIRATEAGRRGEAVDPQVSVQGDAALLAAAGAVLEVARTVGAVPVRFPAV